MPLKSIFHLPVFGEKWLFILHFSFIRDTMFPVTVSCHDVVADDVTSVCV